jgi:nitric oxide reductase activation protein
LDLWVGPEPLVVDVSEVTSWRERAERAEQRAERAEARVEELAEQVAVLSRMLFGRSSEKAGAGADGGDVAQDGDEQVGSWRPSGRPRSGASVSRGCRG